MLKETTLLESVGTEMVWEGKNQRVHIPKEAIHNHIPHLLLREHGGLDHVGRVRGATKAESQDEASKLTSIAWYEF